MGLLGMRLRVASFRSARGAFLLAAATAGFAACSGTTRFHDISGAQAGANAGGADDSTDGGGSIAGKRSDGGGGRGGTGGKSGTGGSGGTSRGGGTGIPGFAGRGGAGGAPATGTKLGRACSTKAECADPKFPELTCITGKDAVLGNGAPPKGLCTMPCDVPTADLPDDPCEALAPGGLCFPFDSSSATTGYCVEGCSFGAPGLGEPAKCHNRPEFACNPALLGATSAACKVSGDCQAGELCSAGVCNVVLPACLPACAGDIDCEDGFYCDQSFLSGVCVTKKPTGKALGEPCTPPGPNEPDEPDECLGYCAPDVTGGTQGHCVATCTYGAPCAYNNGTQLYDGACILINQQIVGASPDVGDFGYCDLTCNCAAECLDPTLACTLLDSPLPDQFRGGGFCLEPTAGDVAYDQCVPGAGGAP